MKAVRDLVFGML